MLAMADANGVVSASIPGLADRARVPIEDCLAALDAFTKPDKWSRSKEFEGRRIVEVDGGWALLNHAKYRAVQDAEHRKEQSRLAMQRLRAARSGAVSEVSAVNTGEQQLTQAEADSEAKKNNPPAKPARPRAVQSIGFARFWDAYPKKVGKAEAERAWGRLGVDEQMLSAIMAAVAEQSRQPSWRDTTRKYVPNASTWLNGRRWEDQIGSSPVSADVFAGAI
jgi:hypothetical protein